MKKDTSYRVTPEEALAISDYNDVETMRRAAEVARVCGKMSTYRGTLFHAVIYQAGVIDGVRRERAKQRAKKNRLNMATN